MDVRSTHLDNHGFAFAYSGKTLHVGYFTSIPPEGSSLSFSGSTWRIPRAARAALAYAHFACAVDEAIGCCHAEPSR